MNIKQDEIYMRMALSEAKKGIGRTSPNPSVGAVIVKNNNVIATGYHKKAGTPHAEIHALSKAGENAKDATIYVTLEPCNHTGRTPPCSHAVAQAGITRVVVGMRDPNPLVNGTGIDYLKNLGIEIQAGVLENECIAINHPFIKHITTGLPWIVMKAGMSLDGKLTYEKGKSGWITGLESGRMVHRLRDRYDAIMVGSNTVRIDNPSLTTRLPKGRGKDPIRIILDRNLSLDINIKPFSVSSPSECWVFCDYNADLRRINMLEEIGVKVFPVGSSKQVLDMRQVFKKIGAEGLNSVLVEGGAKIHGALLQERLYDYANLFIAPFIIGDGGVPLVTGYSSSVRENVVALSDVKYKRFGEDIMVSGRLKFPEEVAEGKR